MNVLRAQFASYCAHVRAHPIKHGTIYGLTIGAMILSRSPRQLRVFPFAPVIVLERPCDCDLSVQREPHVTLISFKDPRTVVEEQFGILKDAASDAERCSEPSHGHYFNKEVTLKTWSTYLDYVTDREQDGDQYNVKVSAKCTDIDGLPFYLTRIHKDDVGLMRDVLFEYHGDPFRK